jgi:hypothetical protein
MLRRIAFLGWVAVATLATPVRADQARDWMLRESRLGTQLRVDYFGTGGQLALEHRGPIYGRANDYSARVATLVGYPLAQLTASAALRIVFLEIEATVGYRGVWRNLSFEPGASGEYCVKCDQPSRRQLDPILGKGAETDKYMFAELTAQFYAPLNDYFVFTTFFTARYEDSRPRSYDWFFTNIHDGGVISRWETLAFVKHRDWGGIGPYVQLMILPRGGKHEAELAWGFNAVTRLGLLDRNDLLFLTFLVRPGDELWGSHSYHAPIRALLIYRAVFAL